jgi:cytochrome c-type biogenesis protein CcmH
MLRRKPALRDAADYDSEVYRDQLRQIERDHAEGLIGDREAEAGRAEVGRRLLTADARRKAATQGGARPAWGAAFAIGILLPVSAFLLYADLGAPGLPGFPHAEQNATKDRGPELQAIASQLKARLEQDPTDVRAWALLARTYTQLEEYGKAAQIYEKALGLDGGNSDLRAAYGEALVLAAKGVVTPEARQAFDDVVRKDPGDARALFYLAVADEQAGKLTEALGRWRKLIEASPPDAPWIAIARERAGRTAAALGLDAGTALPLAAKGPTAGDVAAAQSMTPEDRRAMIESMVEQLAGRLKAQPEDLQGWLRLGRSYTVLEKHADARDALAKAAALAPENTDVLLLQGRAIRAAAGDKETPESLAVMRRVLALDPQNIEALWLVGLSEAGTADRDAGLAKMQQALDRLPADAPNRDALVQRLDALKGGKK